MSNIPREVVQEIIEYLPDIDVRRSFNIYRKVAIPPAISTITFTQNPETVLGSMYRYTLPNLYDFPERDEQDVENDVIDIIVNVRKNTVDTRMYIFRLKPKEGDKAKENLVMFYKGNLDGYYWDYSNYEWTRE